MTFRHVKFYGPAAIALMALGGGAQAATYTPDGNLCNTGPLAGCTVGGTDATLGLEETEAIAKIEFPSRRLTTNDSFGDDDIDLSDVLSIDGNFSFSLTGDDDVEEGTVIYTLSGGAPGITAYSVKRGQDTTLYWGDAITYDDSQMSFTFDLGEYEEGEGDGVSSLVIYDNFNGDMTPVPLPAAGWLLIAGLGGMAAMRRRQR